MALTEEMIKANKTLASLSAEQIADLITLSTNDENEVIGKRFGEVYRQMDENIEKYTGVKREGAEKTYLYLERATKQFVDKYKDYDDLKGQIDTLKEEKKTLESKVASGADEATKAQLESVKRELADTKGKFNDLQEKYTKAEKDHAKTLSDYRVKSEINKAMSGLTLKKGLNEAAVKALSERAISNVMALNPSFEERDGREVLIFHDENGSPLNNEKNKLNPYTATELLTKEFDSMDLLEKGSKGGAGGRQVSPAGGSILTATTKSEADNEIHKMLTSEGLVRGTEEYQEKYTQIYKDNKVQELPY